MPIRPSRPGGADRGAATLELAVLTPAIILITFAIVQVTLTGYARNLAQSAAAAGLATGRSVDAVPGAGAARARAFLADHAADTLHGASVSDAGTTAETVRITVSGRCVSAVPGLPGLAVRVSLQAPRERFHAPETP